MTSGRWRVTGTSIRHGRSRVSACLSVSPSCSGLARRPTAPNDSAYFDEVGIDEIDLVGPAVVAQEVLLDSTVGVVVEDHGDHVDSKLDGGGQLLAGEEESAVAGESDDGLVGGHQLGAQRHGKGVPERPEREIVQPGSRLVYGYERPRPVAEQMRVGGDYGLVGQSLAQGALYGHLDRRAPLHLVPHGLAGALGGGDPFAALAFRAVQGIDKTLQTELASAWMPTSTGKFLPG